MPVRFRITLLFSLFAFVILTIVCGSIYYFSYQSRLNTIKTRLTNRAITTARLLSQRERFDNELVRRIDSLTTISLKAKAVQAYNYQNRKLYSYTDLPNDTLTISGETLDNARVSGTVFFRTGDKEAVAYHYADSSSRMVVVTAAKDEEGQKNLATLRKILLASFFVGLLFVFVSGYFFSRRLLRPIQNISADVAEISAQNLTRRIKTGRTKDEWYRLTDTVNELLNRLQESFELQRRFVSNASHELSTPLTAISSQLEVSLLRDREATEYKKVMQSIYQDVQHLTKLTQTLLEFAKASGNKGGLELSPVRIDEVVMRLPAEAAKADESYSVLLRFDDLPENQEELLVYGNEALLLTALRNIVVNACKYSEEHRASVGLQATAKEIVITITDRGKGIPEDKLTTIFQPFYRVEENTSAEGFGLGLSLADRIVKLHKGSITVSSKKGEGTVFVVRIPAANGLLR